MRNAEKQGYRIPDVLGCPEEPLRMRRCIIDSRFMSLGQVALRGWPNDELHLFLPLSLIAVGLFVRVCRRGRIAARNAPCFPRLESLDNRGKLATFPHVKKMRRFGESSFAEIGGDRR